MAVSNAMFLFEVVVQSVNSYVESRFLVIKSDFADIFSLELKDPKQMYIVMPEPTPLPPEPAGKKGKKKPKPKPKKGKKGKVEPPPPEPVIQSGQSVLFSSSAEFLIQSMNKFPLELSLWSKEDNLVYIGSTFIPWDPKFVKYLELICNCQDPPPVTLVDDYNIFEEGTAKLMAKLGIQIKLSYLTEKVTTAFRTLSEDPTIRKCLYTGINSKTTSYICTMKTTDEDFEENSNKIENNFIVDKPKVKPVIYADYKNAPAANLTFFNDGDYCCMSHADKPPESIYKAPETCPDIDFIVDYVRKIIVSCNDNMRMLTPRPTITPRIKATDIEKYCYCKETKWPSGSFAQRFKKEAQTGPCPVCIDAGQRTTLNRPATFDIANIRGPCGRAECRIARDMRAYIENLVDEDNEEIDFKNIVGPCGSRSCILAKNIQQFIRHEGAFSKSSNLLGLSTQCACVKQMQDELTRKRSCESVCSKDCESTTTEESACGGEGCPFKEPKSKTELVYNVYYFTVEYNFDKESPKATAPVSPASESTDKFQYCAEDCVEVKTAAEKMSCSKDICGVLKEPKEINSEDLKCQDPVCPALEDQEPSPADSAVVINFEDIHNPCCVKNCNAADRVKDFIVDNTVIRKKKLDEDPCFCDCVCSFKFSSKTTYCSVCGGYECLGDDMKDQPPHLKPHPCPIYHKLYDKKNLKTKSPWPEEETAKKQLETASTKSTKGGASKSKLVSPRSTRNLAEKKSRESDKKESGEEKEKKEKIKREKKIEKKAVGKFTANVVAEPPPAVDKKVEKKLIKKRYPYPSVKKSMGWNWTADDIPGLKVRPKWKPGAAHKLLVRKYRQMREGIDNIAKKKRAMMQRKKKIEMKPTLVVRKQDGEYTVQMEVFKKYSKERLLFQYPYDEKPPLIYTIGKTAEEKQKIQKQRERRERRETRRKSRLLQSTFRDKCQEICLKAYNQAIGILPLPNPNDPACPCQTKAADDISPPIDSCSCSEEDSISSSDTDGDEWTIEFTPPAARWDAKAKHPPGLAENETQYTYLDYKVKVLDKAGNQVPRYFKGPDGSQECSDLGGFWGPGHVWLEINRDGYLGPDNRWVPMNFTGPDGMAYTAEDGGFTDNTGRFLRIGIDGYIDKDGKWAWYSKLRGTRSGKSTITASVAVDTKKATRTAKPEPPSKAGVKPDPKAKAVGTSPSPVKGKGATIDKKPVLVKGPSDKPKKTVSYTGQRRKSQMVMSVSLNYDKGRLPGMNNVDRMNFMDPKKAAKYREIMQGLQMYDDLCELKPPMKTNRASNTPRKKISPFTMYGNHGTYGGMTKTQTIATVKSFANSSTSNRSGSPIDRIKSHIA